MARAALGVRGIVCFAALYLLMCSTISDALSLDQDGDMKLTARSYVNARVGTQDTSQTLVCRTGTSDAFGNCPQMMGAPANNLTRKSQTFPFSSAGHLRQNRGFLDVKLEHNLKKLQKQGAGPLEMLNNLPFPVRELKYVVRFRGEFDGLYDWGGREYSTATQFEGLKPNPIQVGILGGPESNPPCIYPFVNVNGKCHRGVDVLAARQHLRHFGTDRERLFEGYLEASVGRLFTRVGRQVLSWGETDGFRLLDNINPLDSSFGGFLISLDERRVPLDMMLLNFNTGDLGPVTDSYLEFYGAIDNKVGYAPGIPPGSPCGLPNLGDPSPATVTDVHTPSRTFRDIRGGGLFKWNMFDATFSVAHYYTYFDTPALQVFTAHRANGTSLFPTATFGYGSLDGTRVVLPQTGFSAVARETAPLVQVTGGTTTFAVPSLYSVVRSEFAYFRDEPRFRQSHIDPFMFTNFPGSPSTGGRDIGDSVNYVLGLDVNQYIRFLNPNQTFFFSTQFFYKRLLDAADHRRTPKAQFDDGEVLPVPNYLIQGVGLKSFDAAEPVFVHNPTDQFLQTLFVGTSYRSGTINPGFTFFYDWSGAFVYQPAVEFSHDPFRFDIDMSILDAATLKGASGVSLLRDRDNIQFRFEYVI